jgi:hypothetical protein
MWHCWQQLQPPVLRTPVVITGTKNSRLKHSCKGERCMLDACATLKYNLQAAQLYNKRQLSYTVIHTAFFSCKPCESFHAAHGVMIARPSRLRLSKMLGMRMCGLGV